MLIFTKFKNSFDWIVRESLLHKVSSVHKQTSSGIETNTLQTQGMEITLI